jgi:hypothetical protein
MRARPRQRAPVWHARVWAESLRRAIIVMTWMSCAQVITGADAIGAGIEIGHRFNNRSVQAVRLAPQ